MAQPKEEKEDQGIPEKPKGFDLMCQESKDVLASPTVVCQIRRSKNDNRVIYEANLIDDPSSSGKKILDPSEPIKVFWLKIEPSYIEKHRKSGKKDDRTELTFLESNMAYGISWQKTENKGEYKIIFVALKERPAILKIDPKDDLPKCFGKMKDKESGKDIDVILTDMYVHTKENWVGLPTVNYINLNGYKYECGTKVTDKITK